MSSAEILQQLSALAEQDFHNLLLVGENGHRILQFLSPPPSQSWLDYAIAEENIPMADFIARHLLPLTPPQFQWVIDNGSLGLFSALSIHFHGDWNQLSWDKIWSRPRTEVMEIVTAGRLHGARLKPLAESAAKCSCKWFLRIIFVAEPRLVVDAALRATFLDFFTPDLDSSPSWLQLAGNTPLPDTAAAAIP